MQNHLVISKTIQIINIVFKFPYSIIIICKLFRINEGQDYLMIFNINVNFIYYGDI